MKIICSRVEHMESRISEAENRNFDITQSENNNNNNNKGRRRNIKKKGQGKPK